MKYLFTDIYNQFECVGGTCPMTCCNGWDIFIDKDTYKLYDSQPEPLRSEILNCIELKDEKYRFILNDERYCPLLNEDGLCSLYTKISPDALSDTCQVYPRKQVLYYDVVMLTLSMSCPEVVRLMLNNKGDVEFQYTEDDVEADTTGADWNKYNELINAFIITVDILNAKDAPLWKKIRLISQMTALIQSRIDEAQVLQIRKEIGRYKDKNWRRLQYDSMLESGNEVSNPSAFLHSLFNLIKYCGDKIPQTMNKFVFPNIPEEHVFKECKNKFFNEAFDQNEYTKVAIQLIFEYYMDALNGKNLKFNISKLITYLVILYVQELSFFTDNGKLDELDRCMIIAGNSRVLEHSAMFDTVTQNLLNNNGDRGIQAMLTLLIN